jgi:hypothetical protein
MRMHGTLCERARALAVPWHCDGVRARVLRLIPSPVDPIHTHRCQGDCVPWLRATCADEGYKSFAYTG